MNTEALRHFVGFFHSVSIGTIVSLSQESIDVLVVAVMTYYLMMLAKGTRAWQVLIGLVFFVFILLISQWLHLDTLNWLIARMFLLGPVAIVILFLPELRHALEEVGRLGFWGRGFVALAK